MSHGSRSYVLTAFGIDLILRMQHLALKFPTLIVQWFRCCTACSAGSNRESNLTHTPQSKQLINHKCPHQVITDKHDKKPGKWSKWLSRRINNSRHGSAQNDDSDHIIQMLQMSFTPGCNYSAMLSGICLYQHCTSGLWYYLTIFLAKTAQAEWNLLLNSKSCHRCSRILRPWLF